ncbi:Protein DENND6A [Sarcoptes scabiei]|uniref:Protein DENND6A n=1 Tax=Sarcoptes scabiei TaxID=52283 RepID=A0A834VCR5_SARSC|nr:Protein DENND6A [Sarcoptes scabiei]
MNDFNDGTNRADYNSSSSALNPQNQFKTIDSETIQIETKQSKMNESTQLQSTLTFDHPLSEKASDIDDIILDEIRSLSSSSLSSPSLISKRNGCKRFSQWIYCIAVVNFDIEIGQSIESLLPKDIQLTEKEISNICYLSFPDSNSGCMGDTQFYFRTKSCESLERPNFDRYYREFNSKCLPTLEADRNYFYGFVHFRQVKDHLARRGYFQKSLVIISWLPFFSLFSTILKSLAPQYFDFGLPSLEAACSDIDRWPALKTDEILSLPLFGNLNHVFIPGEKHVSAMCQNNTNQTNNGGEKNHPQRRSISTMLIPTNNSSSLKTLSLLKFNHHHPHHHNNYQNGKKIKSEHENGDPLNNLDEDFDKIHIEICENVPKSPIASSSILNVANDINLYRSLMPIIGQVQLLWELILTNEPIAVITQTPNVCSEIVNALVHLISPLKYGADYRPFFTIHDSEFREYIGNQSKSLPPVILGVTNPFFVKTLQEWPHLIKINENIHEHVGKMKKFVHIESMLKMISTSKSLEIKTGVYTKYKPFLQKDREILKKLLNGIENSRSSEAQKLILHRFLAELTQSFLIPLERYFASLMPLARNLSPFKRPPLLHHFKIDDFINSLDATGPHLTSLVKGDWNGLYRRFLRSPNFVCWYNSRMKEANRKILKLHLDTICDTNLVSLLEDKPEIEIVDFILRLKENLETVNVNHLQLPDETLEKLQNNMEKIIEKLPEDSRCLFERSIVS